MAHYLVTGVAGFIASRVAEMMLDDGHTVHGVDNMNDAYDVRMKEYRLRKLDGRDGFSFSTCCGACYVFNIFLIIANKHFT